LNKRSARIVYAGGDPDALFAFRGGETLFIRQWCKLSIRTLMACVRVAGVAVWLSLSAYEVYSTKDVHIHTFVETSEPPSLAGWNRPAPFWPRYARRLLGRPWRRQPLCEPTPGAEEEMCEFAHPEMAVKIGGRVAYEFSSEQGDRLEAIEAQRRGTAKAEPPRGNQEHSRQAGPGGQ
jgi:hypothetical protein